MTATRPAEEKAMVNSTLGSDHALPPPPIRLWRALRGSEVTNVERRLSPPIMRSCTDIYLRVHNTGDKIL